MQKIDSTAEMQTEIDMVESNLQEHPLVLLSKSEGLRPTLTQQPWYVLLRELYQGVYQDGEFMAREEFRRSLRKSKDILRNCNKLEEIERNLNELQTTTEN